jgi:NAD(P)-dependent dehydrogenase (short-subunit alcohol dehydrogenase family)
MKEFKNKVAVITGAASGIGRGIAERCIKEGMKVILADINEKNLANAEHELKALGGTVVGVPTDVAKRSDVEQLARKSLDIFGEVHLLVNNAGVGAGSTPWEATWNDWEWTIGVNLWGVIHGVKVFTPLMLAQNTECHIVNTASTAGVVIGSGSAPYCVTKHAVVALSENLYLTMKHRKALINVSVLCPGFVKTNIANAGLNRPHEFLDEPVEPSPEERAARAFMDAAINAGLPPSQVADQVFEAIGEERFYILTDLRWTEAIRMRVENLLRLENPQSPIDVVTKIVMGNR